MNTLRTSAAAMRLKSSRAPPVVTFRRTLPQQARRFASTSSVRSSSTEAFSSSSASVDTTQAASSTIQEAATSTGGFEILEPWVSTIQNLSDTLHLSGPYAHTLSIVALAFAVRTVFTLPIALWQRKKTRIISDEVLPEWNQLKESIPQTVRARCRRSGKSYDEFQRELQKEMKDKLAEVLRKHNASPLPAFVGPAMVSIPVFLVMTALLRQSALDPSTPFASEVLPWWSPSPEMAAQFKASTAVLADRGLDSEMIAKLRGTMGGPTLVDRDTTMIGPIGFGMLTMANTELNSWTRRSLAKITASIRGDADASRNKDDASSRAAAELLKGQDEDEPRRARIITNALRVMAIAFIPIASQAPSVLVVYWLSSGVYTFLQNSLLAVMDRRRVLKKSPSNADRS